MGVFAKWPTLLSAVLCVVKLLLPSSGLTWMWCFAPLWITFGFIFVFVSLVFVIALTISDEKKGPKPFSHRVRNVFGKRYTTTTT